MSGTESHCVMELQQHMKVNGRNLAADNLSKSIHYQ